MTPCIWVFDLDGTMIDTFEINRQAYETIGVKMPKHAWGLPWVAWLPEYCGDNYEIASTLHREKTHIYLRRLIETDLSGMILPPLSVAQELYADNPTRVKIITAASLMSTQRLMSRLKLDTAEYFSGLTYEQRLMRLHVWSQRVNVTYVDDSDDTVSRLCLDMPNINVVHYVGQDADTLKAEMKVPTWTQ